MKFISIFARQVNRTFKSLHAVRFLFVRGGALVQSNPAQTSRLRATGFEAGSISCLTDIMSMPNDGQKCQRVFQNDPQEYAVVGEGFIKRLVLVLSDARKKEGCA